ncbi:FAD-dependent oxidoreductase [Bradyrhizobium sp. LHD-71]|uniref:FAD-dependent oxidoreductase n=1 Tax=Bradyrhizobium sp. LHD-71 TaxID=3072141 RepID=UPI00280DD3F8|nr:FAD-dependent oxidoreductase [Bradyrhizobium sp. LHD-71]MDQ8732009.1 FAD-dependent oxidoreductase [Bradyrhizobium sp. LHD-71]
MSVERVASFSAPAHVHTLVIGGGACGLTAALTARRMGRDVLVLERDAVPSGSTALSSGLIPAAGTRFQIARGVADGADLLTADILQKAKGRTDVAMAHAVASMSADAIHDLVDRHGVQFELVESFLYPGHSVARMHGTPNRTGQELMAMLVAAADNEGLDVLTNAVATTLFVTADHRICGVEVRRPGGARERIGCRALVLACSGFGGNQPLVGRHIPAIADALYFGHAGNQGDALRWGEALGAATADLSGYQGHGSVAHPHGVLITWALMMEGGVQVNAAGVRFANEHAGYSEQAEFVLSQPGGIAFNIYDERLHQLGMEFEDYRSAVKLGAIKSGDDAQALAYQLGVPGDALAKTLQHVDATAREGAADAFGRRFDPDKRLMPPYRGVRVTGTLFHTQGGLVVDRHAHVLRANGERFPNLFAGGGAARGLSGPEASGYLSGNGLLTAVTLGRAAGFSASSLN